MTGGGGTVRYSDDLRERFADHLRDHRRRTHADDGRKRAAVAIVLVDSDPDLHDRDPLFDDTAVTEDERSRTVSMDDVPGDTSGLDGRIEGVAGGAAFLLSLRASRLNRHAGQWALPGGRVDAGETPIEAALREVDEEVGLRLDEDSVVGWLDDYPTRSGYVITPVVLWGGADPDLHPSPDEVLALYRIGLHALGNAEPRFVSIPESDRPVVQIPLGNNLIHAPTGAVLLQFRRVAMEGRIGERVDHLEQPVFAWR